VERGNHTGSTPDVAPPAYSSKSRNRPHRRIHNDAPSHGHRGGPLIRQTSRSSRCPIHISQELVRSGDVPAHSHTRIGSPPPVTWLRRRRTLTTVVRRFVHANAVYPGRKIEKARFGRSTSKYRCESRRSREFAKACLRDMQRTVLSVESEKKTVLAPDESKQSQMPACGRMVSPKACPRSPRPVNHRVTHSSYRRLNDTIRPTWLSRALVGRSHHLPRRAAERHNIPKQCEPKKH